MVNNPDPQAQENPGQPDPQVQGNPGQKASNFLLDNWDKLVTLAFGGVVGYFAALQAIDSKVDTLADRIVHLEAEKVAKWDPALADVEQHNLELIGMNNRIGGLQNQQELTDKIIEINTDQFQMQFAQVRKDTLATLKSFLDEYREDLLDIDAN